MVTQPDAKKGEKLILLTDNPNADRDALNVYGREQGVAAIAVPGEVLTVKEVPLLGTGKTDFVGVKCLVDEITGG